MAAHRLNVGICSHKNVLADFHRLVQKFKFNLIRIRCQDLFRFKTNTRFGYHCHRKQQHPARRNLNNR